MSQWARDHIDFTMVVLLTILSLVIQWLKTREL